MSDIRLFFASMYHAAAFTDSLPAFADFQMNPAAPRLTIAIEGTFDENLLPRSRS